MSKKRNEKATKAAIGRAATRAAEEVVEGTAAHQCEGWLFQTNDEAEVYKAVVRVLENRWGCA